MTKKNVTKKRNVCRSFWRNLIKSIKINFEFNTYIKQFSWHFYLLPFFEFSKIRGISDYYHINVGWLFWLFTVHIEIDRSFEFSKWKSILEEKND